MKTPVRVAALTLGLALVPAAPVSASPAAADCTAQEASITWGFKESFRSYISGSIANGEWTVADGATYETPSFGFSGGTGSYDPSTAGGQLDFTGSITFTGHGGILNTTVANPSIVFIDPATAYLLLDVTGTTQQGAAVASTAVLFAQLDLAAATATTDDATTTIADAPAELAPDGAAAFGTYEAGEPLDPLTISVTTSTECASAAPAVDEPAQPAEEASADTAWMPWAAIALALAAGAAAAFVIVRRRRAN